MVCYRVQELEGFQALLDSWEQRGVYLPLFVEYSSHEGLIPLQATYTLHTPEGYVASLVLPDAERHVHRFRSKYAVIEVLRQACDEADDDAEADDSPDG
ncbi:MAG: hypothetical protein KDI44_14320 [Thiothrix sp.]|nr:hypothetical protein [Thiothrix sp.]HPQ96251.1 hypothetical protein [Thiolinea sp.]